MWRRIQPPPASLFIYWRRVSALISTSIAKALYLALHEDTGGFGHGNTTSRTHDIVSRLYEAEPALYTITQWLKYYRKYGWN
jgi:nanoRNase/pAp phosphatase (c-di-AMP/oligoRNAs hydrolase)